MIANNTVIFQRFAGIGALLCAAVGAHAHFVFVVPEPGGATAKVILSEDLQPGLEVDAGLIGGAKLALRDSEGHETPLTLTKSDHAYLTALPGGGTRLIYGVADLGVMERGGKTYDLVYYPKTIAGDPFDAKAMVGSAAPVEIVPVGQAGALRLKLLAHGQPQPDMEITVILPDGKQTKMKTGASGQTSVLPAIGRYGAWARYWEPSAGERDGKPYQELRNYATLVVDVTRQPAPESAASKVTAKEFGALPRPAASFGAVADNGWLYVYGGHIAPTHSYSTASVTGEFARYKLAAGPGAGWEKLPNGPAMQGVNIAAFDGKIYRAGGMEPRNSPGTPQNIQSVADAARFDLTTMQWEPLPDLPEPRSSHDVAVVGHRLFVVGGWTLKGSSPTEWPGNLISLDLSAAHPQWISTPQPFKRRALVAASFEGLLFAIGGFDDHSQIQRSVDIYDPGAGSWTKGPDLPGQETNGFAPAACVANGSLYVSVADGSLYRLSSSKSAWEKVGASTPRLAHRIVPDGANILVIGGADQGKDFALIESISVNP